MLRSQNSKRDATQGLPPVPSDETLAKDRGTTSVGNNGEFSRPRESVNQSLETQRQQFISRLRDAEKAAQIPNFEEHLRDQARAKDLNEDDQDAFVDKANEAVGGSTKFNAAIRRNAHVRRRVATSLYEDFLYYQMPEYRN